MERLISVIIPTHNRPRCVQRAVGSVLNQTYKNVEIIIVDDTGSAKETVAEITRTTGGNITYLQIPPTPYIAESRNAGIREARGDFIAFLDDDDVWLPEKLGTQLEIFEGDPAIGLVCGNMYRVKSEKQMPGPLLFPHYTRILKGRLFLRMLTDCFCPVSTLVLRRPVLDRVTGFIVDPGLEHSEDVEFLCRCALVTGCYFDPLPHALYLDHDTDAQRAYPSHTVVLEKNIEEERPDYYALTRMYQVRSVGTFAREGGIPLSHLEGYFLYCYMPFFWDMELAKVYLKHRGPARGSGHILGAFRRNPGYIFSIPLYLYFILKHGLGSIGRGPRGTGSP